MRLTPLACILALLVLAAVPLAIAEGAERGQKGRDVAAAHAPDAERNATHVDRNATHVERNTTHAEAGEERGARAAAMETFLAKLHALRASWLDNATKVREACHAQDAGDNMTKEQREARAHCIRDGYAGWREQSRAQMRDLRAQLRAMFS